MTPWQILSFMYLYDCEMCVFNILNLFITNNYYLLHVTTVSLLTLEILLALDYFM